MVVLLGKTLNPYKRAWYALRTFEGVGLYTAKQLCDKSLIHPLAKVKDLADVHLVRLKSHLQPMLEERRQNKLIQLKTAKSMPKPILPT